MKKLFLKLLLCLIPVLIYVGIVYEIDTYNVFHYDKVRITAAKSNHNYIKTRYILDEPDKFNGFIFGSSRAGNIPAEGLPGEINGKAINWYNMQFAMASVKANTETVKTLLKNGVHMDCILLEVDEISMYNTYQANADDYICIPYEEYEKNRFKFIYKYLSVRPEFSLLPAILSREDSLDKERELFYSSGVSSGNLDMSVPSEKREMIKSLGSGWYNKDAEYKEPIEAVRELKGICEENGIELIVFTSPVLQSTYEEAVEKGYIDFLQDLSEVTEYYNFSGLNEYTTDARYYFDASHFRPFVGLEIEKVIFGNEKTSDVSSFGAYITGDNIEKLCERLRG